MPSSPKSYASETDSALLQLLAAGEGAAYQELWVRHIDAALRVARRVAPSHAEDLAAEAFLNVYSQVTEGNSEILAFRAYLFTVIRNLAAKLYRENSRFAQNPDAFLSEVLTLEDASGLAESTQETRSLLAAFLALPARWQRVLWLTEIEGRKRSEIAAELGLRPNAVSLLTRRARTGLRVEWLRLQIPPKLRTDTTHIGNLIPALIIGEISAADQDTTMAHLNGCSACSKAYRNAHASYRSRRKGALLITSGFGALGVVLAPATTPAGIVAVASTLGFGILATGAAAIAGGLSLLGVGALVAPFMTGPDSTAPYSAAAPANAAEPSTPTATSAALTPQIPAPTEAPAAPQGTTSPIGPIPSTNPSATGLPEVALTLTPLPPDQLPDYPLPLPTPPTPADPDSVPPPTVVDPAEPTPNLAPETTVNYPSSTFIAPVLSGIAPTGAEVAVQLEDNIYLTPVGPDSTWTYDLRSLGLAAGPHSATVWTIAPDDTTSPASNMAFTIDALGVDGIEDGTLVDLTTEEGDRGLVFTLQGPPSSTVCIASDVGQNAVIDLDASGTATKRILFLTSGVYGLHLATCDESFFGPETIRTVWASRGIFDPWLDDPYFEITEP